MSLQTDLDTWTTKLANLEALYDKLVASTSNEYEISDGTGRQRVTKKSLAEVRQEIDYARGRVAFFTSKLNGGMTHLRLRRKVL